MATVTGGMNAAATNSTTYVDIIAAPGTSTRRNLQFISVYNADSAIVTIIFEMYDGSSGFEFARATITSGNYLVITADPRDASTTDDSTAVLLRKLTLNSTSKKVRMKLAGAVATTQPHVVANYLDYT